MVSLNRGNGGKLLWEAASTGLMVEKNYFADSLENLGCSLANCSAGGRQKTWRRDADLGFDLAQFMMVGRTVKRFYRRTRSYKLDLPEAPVNGEVEQQDKCTDK
jgi:hypothetical protein